MRMNISIISILMCLLINITFLSQNIYAQKGYIKEINKIDKNEKKHGFWLEEDKNGRTELYYDHGKKSGIYKTFSKQGSLNCLGEYKGDSISGTWYYFGDKGHLLMIQNKFIYNKNILTLNNGVYKNKCYTIHFYPEGSKESEGVLLWNNDPEMDDTYEYGVWKYYGISGELLKTKNHK